MKKWIEELRYKLAYAIYPEFFDDMEERLSGLLCHTTGGLLSKTNYTLQGMITAVDDYWNRCCDDCRKDGEEKTIFFLCDRGKCVDCGVTTCQHTADITHAKNFEPHGSGLYIETGDTEKEGGKE